jgi:hypothetical protein
MSERDRAGLVQHEISYREALFHKQTDSQRARYFNSIISSTRMDSMTIRDFAEVISVVGFESAEYRGLQFDASSLVHAFDDSQNAKAQAAVISDPNSVFYPYSSFSAFSETFGLKIRKVRVFPGQTISITNDQNPPRLDIPLHLNLIGLYPSGNIRSYVFHSASDDPSPYFSLSLEMWDQKAPILKRLELKCDGAYSCLYDWDRFSLIITGYPNHGFYINSESFSLSFDVNGNLSSGIGKICQDFGIPVQVGDYLAPCVLLDGTEEDPVKFFPKTGEIAGTPTDFNDLKIKSIYLNGMPKDATVDRWSSSFKFYNNQVGTLPSGTQVTFGPNDGLVYDYKLPSK